MKFRSFVKCLKSWPLNNFSESRMSTCGDPANLHEGFRCLEIVFFRSKLTFFVGVGGSVWEPLPLFCTSCKFPLPICWRETTDKTSAWRFKFFSLKVQRLPEDVCCWIRHWNGVPPGVGCVACSCLNEHVSSATVKHFSALLATPFSANSAWGTCLIYFCHYLRIESVPFDRTQFSLKVEWGFYSAPL